MVTRKPRSFLTAPLNGSFALIQSGSRAGSGANSADGALHGRTLFGIVALTRNDWVRQNFPAATPAPAGPPLSLIERLSHPATACSGIVNASSPPAGPETAAEAHT